MSRSSLETTLTIIGIVISALVLPPAAAVPILTFVIGVLIGIRVVENHP